MKLSVIVPVYKVEQFLDQCVESVLQLKTDFELILVDDGSPDRCGEICELAREVRFTLQKKINMTVEAYDGNVGVEDNEVARATGQKVWVDITIPANLSQYIFPLEFEIEAGALSIYPDANPDPSKTTAERNNMPVRTGATIAIDEATGNLKSGNTFRFVRTLSLEEYEALKEADPNAESVTFTSQFLTNKAASASQVYVANHYFKTGFDGFENPEITYVNTLQFSATGTNLHDENRTVTITCGDWSQQITLTGSKQSLSYDLSSHNFTNDMTVTISGSYRYGQSISNWWGTECTCTYTSTLGQLQNADITLNFTE